MRVLKRARRPSAVALAVVGVAWVMLRGASASAQAPPPPAPRLTGAGVYTADGAGGWGGLHYWNTAADGFYWNLFLADGGPGGAFLNGPDEAAAAVDLPLTAGTHTFGLLGERPLPGSGYETGFAGLNLHLNGADGPTLSVRVPTAEPFAFVPTSVSGPDLSGHGRVPGAGTASFTDGWYTVEITDFRWQENPVPPLGRVGGFSYDPGGTEDLYGQVTLRVTAVPEPSSAGVILVGAAAASGLLRRRRKRCGAPPNAFRGKLDGGDAAPLLGRRTGRFICR